MRGHFLNFVDVSVTTSIDGPRRLKILSKLDAKDLEYFHSSPSLKSPVGLIVRLCKLPNKTFYLPLHTNFSVYPYQFLRNRDKIKIFF